MTLNPWHVENLQAFSYFCCPECVYRSKEDISFQDHALQNHPQSFAFFHTNFGSSHDINEDVEEEDAKDHKAEQDIKEYKNDDEDDKDLEIKKEPNEDLDSDKISHKNGRIKTEEDLYFEDNGRGDIDLDDDYEDFKDEVDELDEDDSYEPKKRKPRKQRQTSPKKVKKEDRVFKEEFCEICYVEFPSLQMKDDHMKDHLNSKGLYFCDKCEELAPDYAGMVAHKSAKHKKKKAKTLHQCTTCQKVFPKYAWLKKHVESVHEKRKVNCPQCNKEVGLHSLDGHIKYFHQTDRTKKSFQCDECEYKTHSSVCLKNHVIQKHRKDSHQFACDQCDKRYAFLSQLRQHKQVKHEGLKPYMCDKCGKSWGPDAKAHFLKHVQNGCRTTIFPDGIKCHSCEVIFTVEGNYIKHHMKVHGGLPPQYKDRELFMCDQCSTLCISKKALRTHVQNTHDEKSMSARKRAKCPHCEKTFAVKQACEEHIKVKHEGITPFKCDQCHRSYGTQYGLKSHKFSMHQRVKCEECGQEVSNTLILTRHKAKAHGIRPASSYQCQYCPLFYTQETQLEKHVMNHHLHQFE